VRTAAEVVVQALASESRYVVSDWRVLLILRRATFDLPGSERRWNVLPESTSDIGSVLRQMTRNSQLTALQDLPGLYRVTVPFARNRSLDEVEILMELNPFSALRHLSALNLHHLSDLLPKQIWAYTPRAVGGQILPHGTVSADWEDVIAPAPRTRATILRTPVSWRRLDPANWIGIREFSASGPPIFATTIERTLIDSLRYPDYSGGITNVLLAWQRASPRLDLNSIITLTDAMNMVVLRNRVGYALDRIGMTDPRIEAWAAAAVRGSSNKFVATEPFSAEHDPRWQMSINAPVPPPST